MHAFTDGRDTLPHAGAGYLAELDATPGRAWGRSSAATGRWTATAAGSAPSAPTTCSCTAAPSTAPTAAQQAVARRLRARRDRRVHRAHAGRTGRRASARRQHRAAFNFRPDRMRQLTRALAEPGFGEGVGGAARLGGPRRRSAGGALHDADPLRGGLALPGRVRARAPRDDARRTCSRAPGPRSCTSPRPRSIRT